MLFLSPSLQLKGWKRKSTPPMISVLSNRRFFLIVCFLRFTFWKQTGRFFGCWERQSSCLRSCLPVGGWRWFWWNHGLWRLLVQAFSDITSLLVKWFLRANGLNRYSAFPWASSNPSLHPAPTPTRFSKFIILHAIGIRVGPPLWIMNLYNVRTMGIVFRNYNHPLNCELAR